MVNFNYRKVILSALAMSLLTVPLSAKEGMWQPSKLKRQESEMQKLGLAIPVEAIYNDSGTGLNNAVVLFGKGCTGEMVSKSGLLFTNHHCAYGTAQSLSTPEKNYLVNGFFASSPAAELPCPGLTVTFVVKTEDVTEHILRNISDTLSEGIRNARIKARISEMERAYKRTTGMDAEIKPFYNGNQYWVSLTETYSDVRLVAFPPNGVGKFGADTDNWMWPRMTGDFAVFRVYASADNKPAAYSEQNVPYKPKAFFPINTSGVQEGDFTMVYGFPYTTQEYISSYQVNQVQYISDPIRIEARERKLDVLDKAMRNDPDVFLKYAAKQRSISNGFKKWKGEIQGLSAHDVIGKKQKYEKRFQEAATANLESPEDKLLLTRIQAAVAGSDNALIASEYHRETVMGVEAIQQSANLKKVLDLYRKGISGPALQDSLSKIKAGMAGFYKNYHPATDHQVFNALIPLYMEQGDQVVAPKMKSLMYNSGNNFRSWGNNVFNNSIVANQDKMYALLDNAHPADSVQIKEDPAFQIYDVTSDFQDQKINPALRNYQERMATLNRLYMKRQMEYLNSGRAFYPDANQTLRLSYGQVEAIELPGSNIYQTTLNDLIPRHDAQIEEFNIPEKLRTLYKNRDFGNWSVNGTVPVNFIASNHTSGGNSGSPVLNRKGELIGINFDRIWQGTMSDIYYEPSASRNVSVDVRYVLFILEKYGNAGWLLNEMKLVK
jgi:hypothetical protein